MSSRQNTGGNLDANVRARIQESHERAKFVLEASKLALDAQNLQLAKGGGGGGKPRGLDISNLFGHQSYILPSDAAGKDRARKSLSPRPSFDPVHDDMQSTRKTIEAPEDELRPVLQSGRSSSQRNRFTLSPNQMSNRSDGTLMNATSPNDISVSAILPGKVRRLNLNATSARDMSVSDILAGSRSEKVRRMSQALGPGTSTTSNLQMPTKGTTKKPSSSASAAVAMFERDENDFIAEIPAGFEPSSPPTCQTPTKRENRKQAQFLSADTAKIPIQLDDFGGEGYLLRNDLSFNQMCNKVSNRTDSICIPLERNTAPAESFYAEHNEILADAFSRLNNTDGMSYSVPDCSTATTIKDQSTITEKGKLRGGEEKDTCLNCSSTKCKCRSEKPQRKMEKSPNCRIVEDKSMPPPSLKIECTAAENPNTTKDPKKELDFCDQHLNYLDRVMKSLDMTRDSPTCSPKKKAVAKSQQPAERETQKRGRREEVVEKENNNNYTNCKDIQVVQARKAKSMLVNDNNCCPGRGAGARSLSGYGAKLSDANSLCCGNNNTTDDFGTGNNSTGKAMSVCSSQGMGGELRRAQSQMSSLSDFNFVNGYLPLKSTHNEISWPSVKLRKSANKSFQIKNTSTKRLIIRVLLDGPGFNFENPEANGRGTLTLQPNEVRTLMLTFNPTVLGPAIGNLIFQPPIEYCSGGGGYPTMSTINSPVTKRVIRLYGYGGHVAMSFERLQQGPVGTKFLPLGNLCNLSKIFEETFIVRNKGNLTGFAAVMLENKSVGKSMFDHAIKICPDKVLVPANSAVKIKVAFQPTGQDMKEMMKIHRDQEVISIGNILLVTGDEPTRCRMKRLIGASKDLAARYSTAQLMNIWADYGQHDCDYDLSELRETGLAVADLMGSFQTKEVALTVNNSTTDMSLIDASGWISEVEDSDALFHTICQPGEVSDCCVSPTDNDMHMLPLAAGKLKQEEEPEDPCNPDEWYVTPNSLRFSPNSAMPQYLTIHSRTSKDRMYEVDSNVANFFCVSPQEGVLTPACDTTNISVRMMSYNVPECQLFIYIFIENDRICVPVVVERGPPEGKATCAKISSEKAHF